MPGDQNTQGQIHASFRFVLDVGGERQGAFTECTLPVVEWEMEEVKEGGLNTFIHQLPGRQKTARLTLKNGIGKSNLVTWFQDAMSQKYARKALTISVLDSKLNSVMTYHVKDACPAKLTGPQLKSDSNTVAIQTLEFICGEITLS